MRSHKTLYSLITLFVAVAFGVAGFICPPTAIVDSSVLWLVSQFLLYSSACIGLKEFSSTYRKKDGNEGEL